jgi:hypothetical protein
MYSSSSLPSQRKAALPRIQGFAQLAIGIALAHGKMQDVSPIIQRRFAGRVPPDVITKANEVAGGSSDGWGGELVGDDSAREFIQAIRYAEILGNIGALPAPVQVPLTGLNQEFACHVVGESKSIPLSTPSFRTAIVLEYLKVAGLAVLSNELLKYGAAEAPIARALLRAAVKASDLAFLSSAAYGVLNGITPLGSYGGTADDIASALTDLLRDHMTGCDPATVTLICSPSTAIGLALLHGSGGFAFPNVTVKGGTMAGLPLLVSAGAPSESLVAIDGSAVLKSDGRVSLDTSNAARIEMSSAPVGAGDVPTGQTQNAVGMFQAESTAIRVVREVAWKLGRPNCVGIINDFRPGDLNTN